MEVQNLSGQDKARKHRKTAKAAISFIVMIVLLVALFFAAVNIGSLKVSFPELLKGLFVKYNEDVATIYDLRFPRIVISMLAGAAIAVSGVLFQAVLKIHLPIRESSVFPVEQVLRRYSLPHLHRLYFSLPHYLHFLAV